MLCAAELGDGRAGAVVGCVDALVGCAGGDVGALVAGTAGAVVGWAGAAVGSLTTLVAEPQAPSARPRITRLEANKTSIGESKVLNENTWYAETTSW